MLHATRFGGEICIRRDVFLREVAQAPILIPKSSYKPKIHSALRMKQDNTVFAKAGCLTNLKWHLSKEVRNHPNWLLPQ